MFSSGAPRVIWDHCFELQAEIRLHTALDMFALSGDVPGTVLTGDTSDISHLCQFGWYDCVWYIDSLDSFDNRKLGRYLGPSHMIGDVMASKILNAKGNIPVRSLVFPLDIEDVNSEIVKRHIKNYDSELITSLGERSIGVTIDNDE